MGTRWRVVSFLVIVVLAGLLAQQAVVRASPEDQPAGGGALAETATPTSTKGTATPTPILRVVATLVPKSSVATTTPTATPTRTPTPTSTPTPTPVSAQVNSFRIEIEGIAGDEAVAISGISNHTEALETGSYDSRIRQRPGKSRTTTLVLRVVPHSVLSESLADWRDDVIRGNVTKRSMSVILTDSGGRELYRYNFFEVWPAAWSLIPLDLNSTGVVTEEFQLVVDYIERG